MIHHVGNGSPTCSKARMLQEAIDRGVDGDTVLIEQVQIEECGVIVIDVEDED